MAIRTNRPVVVNELAHLNDPATAFRDPAQLSFIRTLVDVIGRMAADMVRQNSASPHFILTSPNGTAYRVSVSDAGVLTVVNARG